MKISHLALTAFILALVPLILCEMVPQKSPGSVPTNANGANLVSRGRLLD